MIWQSKEKVQTREAFHLALPVRMLTYYLVEDMASSCQLAYAYARTKIPIGIFESRIHEWMGIELCKRKRCAACNDTYLSESARSISSSYILAILNRRRVPDVTGR